MDTPQPDLRQFAWIYLDLDNKIESRSILTFVKEAYFNYIKEDFFWLPASSTGRHHPQSSLGVGGLLRHTKAAILIAEKLFNIYDFDQKDRDYIIAALALHDIEKPSIYHPIEAKLTLEPLRGYIAFDIIIPLIESHMGQWDQHGKFPKPKTPAQEFVHLCDYVSSFKLEI